MRIRLVLFLIISAVLCGCSQADDITSGTNTEAKAADNSLEGLWLDFKKNMPQDRNAEEDFKSSDFITEFKKYLSTKDSTKLSEQEIKDMLGQTDIRFLSGDVGGYSIRLICYNADLYNKAVTDAPVKNKYTFLQVYNDDEFYFKTLYDGDYYYTADFILFESGNDIFITAVSEYCMQFPNLIEIKTWKLSNGSILEADIFDSYNLEGWSIEGGTSSIRLGRLYRQGASFAEIPGVSYIADRDKNEVKFISGDESFTLAFDGKIYTLNKE